MSIDSDSSQRRDVLNDAPALMLHSERRLLHALVRALRPRRVLEIGTHKGGSTMIICAALDEIGKGVMVCVDPNPIVEPQNWERVAHRAQMVVGRSPDSLCEARDSAGGSFDFVLIDGDHTTEGVLRDVEGLLPHLTPDSYVVFHDSHYWQVNAGIENSLAAFPYVLVDCGSLSQEEVAEGRYEGGHAVVWGGLRLLRFMGLREDSVVTSLPSVIPQAPTSRPDPVRRARRFLTAPLRRYLDLRFDQFERRLEEFVPAGMPQSADPLGKIDVSAHNAGGSPPTFQRVVSQVVSAAQFSHPEFQRLRGILFPDTGMIPCGAGHVPSTSTHRKLWEWCYILRAAEQHGKLAPHSTAVGFGVGSEPIPAALASLGISVLATDRDPEASTAWASANQHMASLSSLAKPNVVSNEALARQVRTRYVDMNAVPDDLGRFDLVWSSCALEHLGTPAAGLDFVLQTLDLVEEGGIAVHTTELELTPRTETADYGNLAVYRLDDLEALVSSARKMGFEIHANWYVSMDTPADRFVSLPPHSEAHLKLGIGDSVSTSVGLLIRRPV